MFEDPNPLDKLSECNSRNGLLQDRCDPFDVKSFSLHGEFPFLRP